MKKRLLLGGLGVMALLVGLATFAANTAQWVNVEARVEKEIEVACVVPILEGGAIIGYEVDPDGCQFGVVFPENIHEKLVEVTLSNSFFNQTVKSSVKYWVLWECKQYADGRDDDGDTIPDCRVDAEHDDDDLVYSTTHGKWMHADEELDGLIRDYTTLSTTATCLNDYEGPDFDVKHIEGLGNGAVSFANPKCFYDLIFTPPACEGSVNPTTDPNPAAKVVDCHNITDDPDPQNWDRFVDLGDDFKIQVYGFGID